MLRDNNEEVEVIQMVNEYFQRYDGLPAYTYITLNKDEIKNKTSLNS